MIFLRKFTIREDIKIGKKELSLKNGTNVNLKMEKAQAKPYSKTGVKLVYKI